MSRWNDTYKDKICTAEEAVNHVRSGQRVFIGSGAAEPQLLVKALAQRGKELAEARERRMVYPDQVAVSVVADLDGKLFENKITTRSGKAIHIRPVKPTDEDMMRDLFYRCSEHTLYHRFFARMNAMPHSKLKKFVNIDYFDHMALVGVTKEDEHEMIVAVARYSVDKSTNAAEVAFLVRDDWQGQGLAISLFKQLIEIARERGIVKFTADVLHDNARMLHIFHKCAPTRIQSTLEAGVYHLSFSIEPGETRV
jgi:acyl-CoA hydrolase